MADLIDLMNLNDKKGTLAKFLSGGEKRKTEILRAVLLEAKYILLDEPFAGVDPISIDEIRGLVRELKNRNIGVLITDHNVRETLKIVDRAYIINDGKIIKYGTPEFVISDQDVRRVYLGEKFAL